MDFEKIAEIYENTFNEKVPMLTTLDKNNELYLSILKNAIIDNHKLTPDELASVFMKDKSALY